MLGRIRKVAGKMSSDKVPIRGEVEADETFLGGRRRISMLINGGILVAEGKASRWLRVCGAGKERYG